MGILTGEEIRLRIYDSNTKEKADHKLVVTPLLDPSSQIKVASLDVRLGNEFIIIRHTNLPLIDPSLRTDIREKIGKYQEHLWVAFGDPFVLHPNQLVLGATLEYFAFPDDLAAQVVGRSSWGRLGLIIATATSVAPGFKGVITLELINAGQVPLILHPGAVIAQLLVENVNAETASYKGRYNCPTGPEFSKIHMDEDMEFWGKKDNFIKYKNITSNG